MLAERGSATSVVSQTISRTRISVLTRNPGQDQIRSTQKSENKKALKLFFSPTTLVFNIETFHFFHSFEIFDIREQKIDFEYVENSNDSTLEASTVLYLRKEEL
ncbi:hypothetical protein Y032_0729g1891 [Ancylostoma ceylanicum]|uniref:Uncharacterized protein n=1 Tax=Ancylostoma ceylanicum TaxID=53326 RepID=A0A016WF77_9BILA|nr:hypothetical protein Y032_0729g1891 [Ancylostoma ceylanicum]